MLKRRNEMTTPSSSSYYHEHEVAPIADMSPVCPNCHAVIHPCRQPFTIEQVKAMMARSHETHNVGPTRLTKRCKRRPKPGRAQVVRQAVADVATRLAIAVPAVDRAFSPSVQCGCSAPRPLLLILLLARGW